MEFTKSKSSTGEFDFSFSVLLSFRSGDTCARVTLRNWSRSEARLNLVCWSLGLWPETVCAADRFPGWSENWAKLDREGDAGLIRLGAFSDLGVFDNDEVTDLSIGEEITEKNGSSSKPSDFSSEATICQNNSITEFVINRNRKPNYLWISSR